MNHVFISRIAKPLSRWLQAFPDLILKSSEKDVSADLVWLDAASLGEDLSLVMLRLQQHNCRFVVLDASPSDQVALEVVQAGACGYVHRLAKSDQLKEVATVVTSGGLWVGPSVLQKIMKASQAIASISQELKPTDFAELTERELAVAQEVGRGLNNREIADALKISERTVKAHLTVAFEKLAVRDRVQLALLMNGINL